MLPVLVAALVLVLVAVAVLVVLVMARGATLLRRLPSNLRRERRCWLPLWMRTAE